MLESAKVTLDYREFKTLVDAEEIVIQLEKKIERLEKEIESSTERKVLDKIMEFLIDAEESKTIKQKQELITKGIEVYCNTFDIPIEEFK